MGKQMLAAVCSPISQRKLSSFFGAAAAGQQPRRVR
jgi:hypothetical protein